MSYIAQTYEDLLKSVTQNIITSIRQNNGKDHLAYALYKLRIVNIRVRPNGPWSVR